MTPMYFGRSEAPLYGVYDAPIGADRNHGVVLCYPFGQEYMRAHRAYRQIATQLTRDGFHVLRFDYRGSGDSSGDMAGVRAEHWLQDIDDAIQELRDTAGIGRISVLGLRLGALLAAIACGHRRDIDRLILWDPVTSGQQYEAELLAEIAAEVPNEYGAPPGNSLRPDGGIDYNGFSMPAGFRESMGTLDILHMVPMTIPRVFHVFSHETEHFQRLREAWSRHPAYRYQYTDAPHDWNSVDNFGGILVPPSVIQTIVFWMEDISVH